MAGGAGKALRCCLTLCEIACSERANGRSFHFLSSKANLANSSSFDALSTLNVFSKGLRSSTENFLSSSSSFSSEVSGFTSSKFIG
jgi:hypothetical protein